MRRESIINVTTKPRPKKKRKSIIWEHKWFIFLVVIFVSLLSFLYLCLANLETRLEYQISSLKKKEMRLRELNRKLRLEISVLKSPQRLQKLAKERFKLEHARPDQIIVLK